MTDNSWSADLNCETSGDKKAVPKNAKKSLYTNQNNDGPSTKTKWSNIFDENRFLNCKSNNEIKNLKYLKFVSGVVANIKQIIFTMILCI